MKEKKSNLSYLNGPVKNDPGCLTGVLELLRNPQLLMTPEYDQFFEHMPASLSPEGVSLEQRRNNLYNGALRVAVVMAEREAKQPDDRPKPFLDFLKINFTPEMLSFMSADSIEFALKTVRRIQSDIA